MKTDIHTKEDIQKVVTLFYDKALKDPMLAPHFQGVNFAKHLPKMMAFWDFVLLDVPGYTTNVFDAHVHLKVGKAHFARWVEIFHETIEENFQGEKANEAKLRASSLGWTFGEKMEQLHSPQS